MKRYIYGLLFTLCVGCAQTETTPEEDAAKLTVSVQSENSGCPNPAYPVAIRLTNGTSKALNRVIYYIDLKRRGHSSVLFTKQIYDDKIVAPKGESGICIGRLAGARRDYELGAPLQDMTTADILKNVSDDEIVYEVSVLNPEFDQRTS